MRQPDRQNCHRLQQPTASQSQRIDRGTHGFVRRDGGALGEGRTRRQDARNMLDPRYGHEALSMFLCGNDADAKKVVTGLVAGLGFEPVDAGPLTQARYLEPLAMLWISM